jgi:hypothetical protein
MNNENKHHQQKIKSKIQNWDPHETKLCNPSKHVQLHGEFGSDSGLTLKIQSCGAANQGKMRKTGISHPRSPIQRKRTQVRSRRDSLTDWPAMTCAALFLASTSEETASAVRRRICFTLWGRPGSMLLVRLQLSGFPWWDWLMYGIGAPEVSSGKYEFWNRPHDYCTWL